MAKKRSTRGEIVRLDSKNARARRAIAQADSAAGHRTKARLAEAREASRATRALIAPFEKLIAADPVAAATLAKMRSQTFPSVAALNKNAKLGGSASTLSLTLHEHLSFAVPPFDYEWHWGNVPQTLSEKNTGSIGVRGQSGNFQNGSDDAISGASGIGLVLTTDKSAIVTVRPYIQYLWAYGVGASGPFSSGSARGGIDAGAFVNGKLVAGVRRSTLFSDSQGWAGSTYNSDNGIVHYPDVTLSFTMEPGVIYAVSFGAWIECDHSDGIGVGGGEGLVQAQVEWVVVDRMIAG
jgi:hypothetical protein